MQLRPTESGTPVDEAGSDPTPLPAVIPPVVVVMVTHDPGPWFEETLASLADQTYPDLGFLVIDTASAEDPTERVHAVLPAAHVHVLDHDPGYGGAVNRVSEMVEGAAFYLFAHDDIALSERFTELVTVAKHRALRTDDWKLIYRPTRGGARFSLFDMHSDPGEQHDLAEQRPEIVAKLRATLFDLVSRDPSVTVENGFILPR